MLLNLSLSHCFYHQSRTGYFVFKNFSVDDSDQHIRGKNILEVN
jgi:hypothetical protein